jgi:lipopolysaccharide/colanic/teichoic acid biosynthesis glycosyltransferase
MAQETKNLPTAERSRSEMVDDLSRRYDNPLWRRLYQDFRAKSRMAAFRNTVLFAEALKRAIDIVGSAAALLLLSPIFGIVALCIWLTDRGPILFWQDRVGRHGTHFRFPKFRSMVTNAEALKDKLIEQNDHGSGAVTFKMKNDPRITWIGRIIRKLSIDELPQFWCVLKGEMSLVGPRPPVPREVALYTLADRRRLEIKPGLTCIWQVEGRGDIPFPEQVQLDVRYIESQSFLLDLKLLVMTVPAVLLGKGAY